MQNYQPTCDTPDVNYRKLNFDISLYDLQTENGVTEILDGDYNYNFYVFPGGEAVKKNIIMEAYGRPTIPWKFECESGENPTLTRS